VGLRGYRMLDVDEVLERLGAELAERDARIADLEAHLAGVHAGAHRYDAPAAPGAPGLGGGAGNGYGYGGAPGNGNGYGQAPARPERPAAGPDDLPGNAGE
jgi:hypothetical protein